MIMGDDGEKKPKKEKKGDEGDAVKKEKARDIVAL